MRVKSKKAFTLIELIVTIALVGIVGLGIALIFTSVNGTIVTLTQQTDVNVKTNYVMQTIEKQLKFAKDLTISADAGRAGKEADKTYIYSRDGKLYIQKGIAPAEDLFNENFYEGYYIDMEVTRLEKSLIRLSITTTAKNNLAVEYALETTMNLLNTREVKGDTGNIVSYIWPTA
ncbi:MAG: prepilin-type N-terminal cleavage/methylation domain-containing protein [Christensenella sp.]